MRSNKKLIIVISIVLTLAVASVVIAYLYLMTDTFKSKQELFMKYFAQNVESFQKVTNLQTFEVYKNLKNQNKYESNTNVKLVNSEGGEVSDPLNNVGLKVEVQKNDEEQYLYADGQLLFENEEYLEAEFLKEQGLYGIRFTDAVKQFVSVRNDEKLEIVANNIGIETTKLKELINIIDGNQSIVDNQQINTLKDKYVNIITQNVSQGTFSKQKKAMITYNNVTTQTNAYSVSLGGQQVENMLIEILNNVKNETGLPIEFDVDNAINWVNDEFEVPTIKVTVYEQNGQTIRTVAEIGLYKITIENIEQNGDLTTRINYINNDEAIQADIEITKKNVETQENFEVTANVIEGEKDYNITLSNQMKFIDNKIELDAELSYKENITIMSIMLENNTIIGNDFEKNQTLSTNNIILNDLEETRLKDIVFILNQVVPQTTNERIKLLEQKFGLKNEGDMNVQVENTETEEQITQVEINKFNAKFEFYTGDEVSAENVRMLLDIAKNHLATYEDIKEEQPQDDTENQMPEEEKVNLKLKIEKDILNEDIANQILEKINESKKYKVSILYDEENGLIDYITIAERD